MSGPASPEEWGVLYVRIPVLLRERLRDEADVRDMSMSRFVSRLLAEGLEELVDPAHVRLTRRSVITHASVVVPPPERAPE